MSIDPKKFIYASAFDAFKHVLPTPILRVNFGNQTFAPSFLQEYFATIFVDQPDPAFDTIHMYSIYPGRWYYGGELTLGSSNWDNKFQSFAAVSVTDLNKITARVAFQNTTASSQFLAAGTVDFQIRYYVAPWSDKKVI